MSKSINNRSAQAQQASGLLQFVQVNQIASPSTAVFTQKTLDLDVLNVRNIYVLDSLYTKTDGRPTGPNKLKLSKGIISNQLNGALSTQKILQYNGVYFEPDNDNSSNVTLYTDDTLKLGNINKNTEIFGERITLNVTDRVRVNGVLSLQTIEYDNLDVVFNITAGKNITAGENIISSNDIQANNNVIVKNRLYFNDNPIKYYQDDKSLKMEINSKDYKFLWLDSGNVINSSNIVIENPDNADVVFDVRGNISCNSVYITSDINKKKDIREITKEEINNLSNLNTYNFNYKSNDVNSFGFMAQEVEKLYPSLSNGQTVNYIGFIPILLEKIKILENEINELKKRL